MLIFLRDYIEEDDGKIVSTVKPRGARERIIEDPLEYT